jgi:hypothetical protein
VPAHVLPLLRKRETTGLTLKRQALSCASPLPLETSSAERANILRNFVSRALERISLSQFPRPCLLLSLELDEEFQVVKAEAETFLEVAKNAPSVEVAPKRYPLTKMLHRRQPGEKGCPGVQSGTNQPNPQTAF